MIPKPKEKRRIRYELLGAVTLSVVLFGIFLINSPLVSNLNSGSENLITGHVSQEISAQNVDLLITQSQRYYFSNLEDITLTSFRVSGKVIGDGLAQIFLETPSGERLLVHQNVKSLRKDNLITGMVAGGENIFTVVPGELVAVSEGKPDSMVELVEGDFYQQCRETCFMSVPFTQDQKFALLFYVDEGTSLRVNQFVFTTQ